MKHKCLFPLLLAAVLALPGFGPVAAPTGLSPRPVWRAEGQQAGANFGYAAAGAGDVNGDGYDEVLVGALTYGNGQEGEGRAFLYLGSAAGLCGGDAQLVAQPEPPCAPDWMAEGNQNHAAFGSAAAGAGDVNGDGFGDVVVGAWGHDNGQVQEGRAYLYLGSAAGLSLSPAWVAESNRAEAHYGNAVAGAGDVNGDGYDDVVVGAWLYDHGQQGEGRAFLYLGSAAGLNTTPAWAAEGQQEFAFFGFSVAGAGDVNGDGYQDVLVGASGYDHGQTDEGLAALYAGKP